MLLTKDDLMKPAPISYGETEVDGGKVRYRSMTLSEANRFDAWLRPGGKLNQKRRLARNLKLATVCLVDADGNSLFDFADTKEGNVEFFEFVDGIQVGAADRWDVITLAVMQHNGWLASADKDAGDSDEDDTLLGK